MVAEYNTFRVVGQGQGYTLRPVTPMGYGAENPDVGSVLQGTDAMAEEMGKRLREARKSKGWTQRELAMQTGGSDSDDAAEFRGLSPSRIGNFEQGTRRLGIEEASIFERLFGQPAAYFLGILDATEAELIATLRRKRS